MNGVKVLLIFVYYSSYLCEVNIDLSLKDCVCSSPVLLMIEKFTHQLLFTRSVNNLATKMKKEKSYMLNKKG